MEDRGKPETDLGALLRTMVPPGVCAAIGKISQEQASLYPVEAQAIANAVADRQGAFRAGRCVARRALAALGVPDQPIVRAADGRPLWPPGTVGAITHSASLCAAIAARSSDMVGLGVDLEPATPLSPSLADLIARPEERGRFTVPVATKNGPVDRGKLVFCAKECVFKACYPQTLRFLDFQDATVEIDADGLFAVRLVAATAGLPGHAVMRGRWALTHGHILAVLSLKQR